MMSGRESHRGIFGSEPTGSVGQSQLRPGEPRRRSYHKLASELNDEGILYTVKVSVSPLRGKVAIQYYLRLVTAFF